MIFIALNKRTISWIGVEEKGFSSSQTSGNGWNTQFIWIIWALNANLQRLICKLKHLNTKILWENLTPLLSLQHYDQYKVTIFEIVFLFFSHLRDWSMMSMASLSHIIKSLLKIFSKIVGQLGQFYLLSIQIYNQLI